MGLLCRQQYVFPKPRQSQNFTSEYEIMRGDLCQVLYDAAKQQAKYAFGTSVAAFESGQDHVRVCLSNGTINHSDLLVGADGQGSSIRNMLFEPGVAKAAYRPLKNMHMAYFTIPRPIKEGEEYIATAYIAPGKRGMMTRRHSPDTIQVYMGHTTKSAKLNNVIYKSREDGDANTDIVREQIMTWKEVFSGAGWQTNNIFQALMCMRESADALSKTPGTREPNFYTECPAMVKLDSWSRGRVALVGDAAWCPTAITGMGTTSAIVGAFALAGEIQKRCKTENSMTMVILKDAMAGYQRTFGPFIDQVQRDVHPGQADHIAMFPTSAIGIAVFLRAVWVLSVVQVNIGSGTSRKRSGSGICQATMDFQSVRAEMRQWIEAQRQSASDTKNNSLNSFQSHCFQLG